MKGGRVEGRLYFFRKAIRFGSVARHPLAELGGTPPPPPPPLMEKSAT